MDYKQKYDQALERAKAINPGTADYEVAVKIFPELKESEDERIKSNIIKLLRFVRDTNHQYSDECSEAIAWYEKQCEQVSNEPNWIHHKVNLSNCSEEYIKAYYDGWNNCNQQYSQVEAEQKPTWSKEDESRINNLCQFLEEYGNQYYGQVALQSTISWLKSIKPQPKQHWSGEDEKMRKNLLFLMEQENSISSWEGCYEWLKSL